MLWAPQSREPQHSEERTKAKFTLPGESLIFSAEEMISPPAALEIGKVRPSAWEANTRKDLRAMDGQSSVLEELQEVDAKGNLRLREEPRPRWS